jgi:adenine phosphoribosyltransferase
VKNTQISVNSNRVTHLSEFIKKKIRKVSDFPKSGHTFYDIITSLSVDSEMLYLIVDHLTQRYEDYEIDGIAAIDARGFIFGAPLSMSLGLPFIPLRKKGKLPPPIERIEYDLEYGSSTLEASLHALQGKRHVLLIDDVLATGGTSEAAIKLLQRFDVIVEEVVGIVEIAKLEGRKRLAGLPVYCICTL